MRRRLTLCADDFAQSIPVSAAILDLLERERVSAVSVMSNAPAWPGLAGRLAQFDQVADIGLHLDLTQRFSGQTARPSVARLLAAGQCGLLSVDTLRRQFVEQIDAFSHHMGRLPDFIDGHQHIHAFPQIREALFDSIALRWPVTARPYLRAPDRLRVHMAGLLKCLVLRCSSRGFTRRARELGLDAPPWFGGVYAIAPRVDFEALMERWLESMPSGALLMCHPGLGNDSEADPIRAQRPREYAYLRSTAFSDALARHRVVLGRWVADRDGLGIPADGAVEG